MYCITKYPEDTNMGKRFTAKVKYVGMDRSYKYDCADAYFLIETLNGEIQTEEYFLRWTTKAKTFFSKVSEDDEIDISFIYECFDTRGLGTFEKIKQFQNRNNEKISFIQCTGRIRRR